MASSLDAHSTCSSTKNIIIHTSYRHSVSRPPVQNFIFIQFHRATCIHSLCRNQSKKGGKRKTPLHPRNINFTKRAIWANPTYSQRLPNPPPQKKKNSLEIPPIQPPINISLANPPKKAMSTASASYPSIPGTISSALSWTFHRLTSDPAQDPPRKSSDPQHLTSEKPPSRRESPFSPPPLAPLQIAGYSPTTTSRLLSRALAEEIRLLLPARLQLYETWTLTYSLEQHGVSLATLYRRGSKGSFVLVVKDAAGGVS